VQKSFAFGGFLHRVSNFFVKFDQGAFRSGIGSLSSESLFILPRFVSLVKNFFNFFPKFF